MSFWLLFIWFDSIIINFVFISGSVVIIVTCSFFGILRWGVFQVFFFFSECLFLSAPSIEVLALVWKGFWRCKTRRFPRNSFFFQDYPERYWSESESSFFFSCQSSALRRPWDDFQRRLWRKTSVVGQNVSFLNLKSFFICFFCFVPKPKDSAASSFNISIVFKNVQLLFWWLGLSLAQ